MPQNGPNNAIENGSRVMGPAARTRLHLVTVFQVRIEDEHIRRDVKYDGSLNGSRSNATAGHTGEAGNSDEDAQSGHSRNHDEHEPDGSKYEPK